MFKVMIMDTTCERSEFVCKENETLLDAARFQGVRIPYGCKGGGCGMCKVKIAEGQYERGTSSKAVLPDTERSLHYTLACKTYPKSDLKVQIEIS